jgi:hypothetical protein
MVMPEMLKAAVEVKIRKLGVPPAGLRLTVRELIPGPLIIMFVIRLGSAVVRSIVPVTEKLIVSEPLLPAAHSPAAAPEAALLFADVIASRNVHNPSLPFATSDKLLTVIVVAALGRLVHVRATTAKTMQIEMSDNIRVRAMRAREK